MSATNNPVLPEFTRRLVRLLLLRFAAGHGLLDLVANFADLLVDKEGKLLLSENFRSVFALIILMLRIINWISVIRLS